MAPLPMSRRVSFGAVQVREYEPVAGYDYPDDKGKTTKMAQFTEPSMHRNKNSSWVFLCLWVMLLGLLQLERRERSLRRIRLASIDLKELPEGTNSSKEISTSQSLKKRVFDGPTLCSRLQLQARSSRLQDVEREHPNRHCALWAVVSTINEPTDAIHQVAKLTQGEGENDWCMVVVGDEETPEEPYQAMANSSNHTIVYLSAEHQPDLSAYQDFMETAPHTGFARKNIGYLYAIAHGARAIYDFEDDAILQDDADPYSLQEKQPRFRYLPHWNTTELAFNPFPLMHPSQRYSWPRGFPLDKVQEKTANIEPPTTSMASLPKESIGVVQTVCNRESDVDAVYRLTRPLPLTFDDKASSSSSLLVPSQAYAPYNAQATVHTQVAFWGLLLPSTVEERVSDIWRSYFAQRIMKDLRLALLYSPPIVHRTHNDHKADLKVENDLLHKSSALLRFLNEWKAEEDNYLPSRIEKLWISLYNHGYIGLHDVQAMQQWLLALNDAGYAFPELPSASTSSMDNTTMSYLPQLVVEDEPSLREQSSTQAV